MAFVVSIGYAKGWRAYENCSCGKPAYVYVTAERVEDEQYYCAEHMPKWAKGKRNWQ